MNKSSYLRFLFLLIVVLSQGCSTTLGTTNIQATSDLKPINLTASIPSLTALPTSTSTPTITDTPTITPTPTPPPDLELTDVTILPNTYNIVDQNYYIMARLRNNTKTTMVLSGTILKMAFDRWEFDEQGKMPRGPYYHSLMTGDLPASKAYYTNYIIYPGEEGTVAFSMFDLSNSNDQEITDMKTYDGMLGITYTYQSFYKFRPDLATFFHAKAENVTFQNEGANIEFDFDLNVPELPIFGVSTDLTEYIVFYDKNKNIIDIMQKMMNDYSGFEFGKKLHVHDSTESAVYREIFLDMTSDMASQINHLDIVIEMTYGGM